MCGEDGCGSGLLGAGAGKNRSYPAVSLRSREEFKVLIQTRRQVPSGECAHTSDFPIALSSRPSWGFSRIKYECGNSVSHMC